MILEGTNLFLDKVSLQGNLIIRNSSSAHTNQQQTNEAFSEKWKKVDREDDLGKMEEFQKNWYLKLYGFTDEKSLAAFLQSKQVIIDAGCGIGYKAAWFAKLAPSSTVIGIDFSEAALIAAKKYKNVPNLFFVRGDIANTGLKPGSIDYVSCDQVIHHTEVPEKTFAHLASLLKPGGEFACYVYAKKALPRNFLTNISEPVCILTLRNRYGSFQNK